MSRREIDLTRRRKYDDCTKQKVDDSGAMPEHALRLGDFRGFTPSDGDGEGGSFGGLADGAGGDWSWKPWRFPGDVLCPTDAELRARFRKDDDYTY